MLVYCCYEQLFVYCCYEQLFVYCYYEKLFVYCYVDHMELYVKVRLNTRPSYQRQHKFARGPVVHKTRNLRGTHNPQWMEDFVVGVAYISRGVDIREVASNGGMVMWA